MNLKIKHYIVAYGISGDKVLLRDVGSSKDRRQYVYIKDLPTGIKNAWICYKE